MESAGFLHHGIADLAWLIASPPLMAAVPGLDVPPAEWQARQVDAAESWLRDLDDNPREFQRQVVAGWLDQQSAPRLGHYAERLLEFWLGNRPGFILHTARLELHDPDPPGATIGELDAVFSCRERRQSLHWELSAKFFLRAQASADWSVWIGPNPNDSLAHKLDHIIARQLPLGRHPAATAALGPLPWPPLRSEAFLKGWLFYPAAGDWRTATPMPLGAHPAHGRGWWLRWGEQPVPQTSRASRYLVLPRLSWLAPVHRPDDQVRVLAHGELADRLARHFNNDGRHPPAAELVAEVQRDGHGWWRETARGFVVHRRWPETG